MFTLKRITRRKVFIAEKGIRKLRLSRFGHKSCTNFAYKQENFEISNIYYLVKGYHENSFFRLVYPTCSLVILLSFVKKFKFFLFDSFPKIRGYVSKFYKKSCGRTKHFPVKKNKKKRRENSTLRTSLLIREGLQSEEDSRFEAANL